jgi:CTP synthase
MEDQKNVTDRGTMRLGAWKCDIKPDSLATRHKSTISERHRHREYNSEFVDIAKQV